MAGRRRFPWQQDELGLREGLSPGWILTLVVLVLFAASLGSLWLADMHHYGYGLFAR